MENKLELFIRAHREEFDNIEPPLGLWSKINSCMGEMNSRWIKSKWYLKLKYFGFSASVLAVLVYYAFDASKEDGIFKKARKNSNEFIVSESKTSENNEKHQLNEGIVKKLHTDNGGNANSDFSNTTNKPTIAFNTKNINRYFVYFDTDKYALKSDAKKTLDSITEAIKEATRYHISIKAHSDNSGQEKSNRLLSFNRANAVFMYFLNKGLDSNLIMRRGYSDTIPIVKNDNELGKSKNRRAEIIVSLDKKITYAELTSKTPDTSLKAGARFIIWGINFEYDKWEFLPNSKPALELLLKLMRDHPTMQIQIDGHVCCRHAMGLSTNRAYAVRHYLEKNGISEKRISTKGFSNFRKIATEDTEEGKRKNRRVEILILKM